MSSSLLTHLYWLIVLDEQQSFTKAAERLNISKASMSLKIKQLEQDAGMSLVQRSTRKVRLTQAGKELVENLKKPYQQIEQSFTAAKDAHGPIRGLVKVTAPVAFSRQHLVPKMSAFLKIYPQVRIQLEIADSLVSLTNQGYDLAIRHSNQVPETHVAIELCRTRTLLVASPQYLTTHQQPQHPNDLAKHQCIYYPRGDQVPHWRFRHQGSGEDADCADINGPFTANNSEAIRDAAIQGLGVALLPDFSVQQALEEGQLVEVLPHWQILDQFAEQIYIVRPYLTQVPKAVNAFSHWLKAQF